MLRPMLRFLAAVIPACSSQADGVRFIVSFPHELRDEPATGRLVVYLIRDGSSIPIGSSPAQGPFWDDPQPLFSIDVSDLAPGAEAIVDDAAVAFPHPPSQLPPGEYVAQAVLDMHRLDSRWWVEPGNLSSNPVRFTVSPNEETSVEITLASAVKEAPFPQRWAREEFVLRSEILSDFHGRDVYHRVGVALPQRYDPTRRHAAIYEIPGFGGDHRGVFAAGDRRDAAATGSKQRALADATIWFTLNPESPNGHTLFADSDNNGPVATALVAELIPALEERYALISRPEARLLRGHSSGGWSAVWLALNYPDTFGAAWASSPDPLDFSRFQLADAYSDNFYVRHGRELPSYRSGGIERMTIRQENLMEEVLGPDNASGQQWDSWQAVFCPRADNGLPAALFDPRTGRIHAKVAQAASRYDVRRLIARDPARYAIIFKERIRIVVGDQDNFYLNDAVASVRQAVDAVSFLHLPEGGHGYIRILPGHDHASVLETDEVRSFTTEMYDHLARKGLIPTEER